MTSEVALEPLLQSISAYLLGGEPSAPLLDHPLDAETWGIIRSSCEKARILGLLATAVAAGDLPATDEQHDEVVDAHVEACAVSVDLEQLLLRTASTLDEAGVAYRVLKGSALAHLDWPDPSLRTFDDVDLLIERDHDGAVAALLGAGASRRVAEARPGVDAHFGKGTTLVAPDGRELDVHRTLTLGAFGYLIDRDELLDGADDLVVGGRTLHALARPQRLMHAAYHIVLGDIRPRRATVRDLAELVLAADHEERRVVRDLARSWQAEVVLAVGIEQAATLVGLPADDELVQWARTRPVTDDERRRLGAYAGYGRSWAAQAWDLWRVLPTVRERVRFAGSVVLASPEHLAAHGTSPWRRLRRGASVAVRSRSFRRR